MTRILIGLSLTASLALAADGARVWKASELKGSEKKLSPKVDAQKIASEGFGKLGSNATAQISHREADGVAELHETKDDFFVVESGEATLELGGSVVDPKKTDQHEVRGPSIKGAEQKQLSAGDIVYIPANTPHRLLVAKGKQFTYFVIKVNK